MGQSSTVGEQSGRKLCFPWKGGPETWREEEDLTKARSPLYLTQSQLWKFNLTVPPTSVPHLHQPRKTTVRKIVLSQRAHAFISSRPDCSNGLFFGNPGKNIQKWQYIQNSAARVLMGIRNHSPQSMHTALAPSLNRDQLQNPTRCSLTNA